ncbi:MAG: tetratricopeptide repeat protein [Rickettsiales bacterium]
MLKKYRKSLLTALYCGLFALSPAFAQEKGERPAPEIIREWVKAGIGYYEGNPITRKNPEKALGFFKKAARYDDPEALYYLAVMRQAGETVEPEDEMEYFKRSAEGGYPQAQTVMGVYHIYEALKHQPDSPLYTSEYKTAAEWLKPAAEAGEAEGQFWYGELLMKGLGMEKDQTAGWKWLQTSAEHGNVRSQSMLGAYYWQGTDTVKIDLEKAYQWMTIAKTNHHNKAEVFMERIAQKLTPEQVKIATAKAEAWLAKHPAPKN